MVATLYRPSVALRCALLSTPIFSTFICATFFSLSPRFFRPLLLQLLTKLMQILYYVFNNRFSSGRQPNRLSITVISKPEADIFSNFGPKKKFPTPFPRNEAQEWKLQLSAPAPWLSGWGIRRFAGSCLQGPRFEVWQCLTVQVTTLHNNYPFVW